MSHYMAIEPVKPVDLFNAWFEPMPLLVCQSRWRLFIRQRANSWKRFDKSGYHPGTVRMVAMNLDRLFRSDFKPTRDGVLTVSVDVD
ncbi:hypothetical protein [Planctomycetes bacterium TBK1r]|uniref:hypothetical protein n=1 Tax=Stieleria magnilauensis TaxID=2527963 RepID=UPI0011A9AD71